MTVPRLDTALAGPLADVERALLFSRSGRPCCPSTRFYAYGVVRRLALLAAAIELEQTASGEQ